MKIRLDKRGTLSAVSCKIHRRVETQLKIQTYRRVETQLKIQTYNYSVVVPQQLKVETELEPDMELELELGSRLAQGAS